MGRIAVVGERSRVAGFALAGALVRPVEEEAAVLAACAALPPDVEVLLLTPAAARALAGAEADESSALRVVLPW